MCSLIYSFQVGWAISLFQETHWPGESITITSIAENAVLAGKISSIIMLGANGELKFAQDANSVTIVLPVTPPCDFAYTLKLLA